MEAISNQRTEILDETRGGTPPVTTERVWNSLIPKELCVVRYAKECARI